MGIGAYRWYRPPFGNKGRNRGEAEGGMAKLGKTPRVVDEEKFYEDFPRLKGNKKFRPTSLATPVYNCIAYAAGENTRPWWPYPFPLRPYYWPNGCPREETVDAFITAFKTLGYEVCADGSFERGKQKVAIFVSENAVTHMARQVPSLKKWKSKFGWNIDGEHELEDLDESIYGTVAAFMTKASR